MYLGPPPAMTEVFGVWSQHSSRYVVSASASAAAEPTDLATALVQADDLIAVFAGGVDDDANGYADDLFGPNVRSRDTRCHDGTWSAGSAAIAAVGASAALYGGRGLPGCRCRGGFMRRALTAAAVVAGVAGCRPAEPYPESLREPPCADVADVCAGIGAGEWQLRLPVSVPTQFVMWRTGCASVPDDLAGDAFVVDTWSTGTVVHADGMWFDYRATPDSGLTVRFPDCELVESTNFPDEVVPQQLGARSGYGEHTIEWAIASGTRASTVQRLVESVESTWSTASMTTQGERHYLYDASAGVEDGVYAWQYCRVHDALVDGVHLTCHRYTFDPDTSRLEMHLTWGEELPCEPGEPLAPLG